MTEQLFEIYESLIKKEKSIGDIIYLLRGDQSGGFLYNEIQDLEILIVKSLGGTEEHHNHIWCFNYFNDYYGGDIEKVELVDYIKETIKNDWKHDS